MSRYHLLESTTVILYNRKAEKCDSVVYTLVNVIFLKWVLHIHVYINYDMQHVHVQCI